MIMWTPDFEACLRQCLGTHDWSWLAEMLWGLGFCPLAVAADAYALAALFARIGPTVECPFRYEELSQLERACVQSAEIPDYAKGPLRLVVIQQQLRCLDVQTNRIV